MCEKWKMGSGGAASLSARNSVNKEKLSGTLPDVAAAHEKDAAQQLSAATADRK